MTTTTTKTVTKVNNPVRDQSEANVFKQTVWDALVAATIDTPWLFARRVSSHNQAVVAEAVAPYMHLSEYDKQLIKPGKSKTPLPRWSSGLRNLAASQNKGVGPYNELKMLEYKGLYRWVPSNKHPRYRDYLLWRRGDGDETPAQENENVKDWTESDDVVTNEKQVAFLIAKINAYYLMRNKTKHLSTPRATFSQRVREAQDESDGRPKRVTFKRVFKAYDSDAARLEDLGWLDRNSAGRDIKYTWEEFVDIAAYMDAHSDKFPKRRKEQ